MLCVASMQKICSFKIRFYEKIKSTNSKYIYIYIYRKCERNFCAQSLLKIAAIRNTQREQKIRMRGGSYHIRKSAGDTAREEKESIRGNRANNHTRKSHDPPRNRRFFAVAFVNVTGH